MLPPKTVVNSSMSRFRYGQKHLMPLDYHHHLLVPVAPNSAGSVFGQSLSLYLGLSPSLVVLVNSISCRRHGLNDTSMFPYNTTSPFSFPEASSGPTISVLLYLSRVAAHVLQDHHRFWLRTCNTSRSTFHAPTAGLRAKCSYPGS